MWGYVIIGGIAGLEAIGDQLDSESARRLGDKLKEKLRTRAELHDYRTQIKKTKLENELKRLKSEGTTER